MPAQNLDFAQEIPEVLRSLSEGRSQIKYAEPILAAFDNTVERREAAIAQRSDLFRRIAAKEQQEEALQHQLKAELEAANSKVEEISREVNQAWEDRNNAVKFISTFANKVTMLSERLPLTQEWTPYRDELRQLCSAAQHFKAWTDPANPTLEMLELRLKEIFDRVQVSPADQAPRPKGRPKDSEVASIRRQIRTLFEQAEGEGMRLTYKELCERLDALGIKLPPGAGWRKHNSWARAYAERRASVDRWISEAQNN